MTMHVHHELSCDHPDCFAAYQSNIDELNSAARTLAGAKRDGWLRRKGKDYCSQHRPDGQPEVTDGQQ